MPTDSTSTGGGVVRTRLDWIREKRHWVEHSHKKFHIQLL